MPGKHLDIKINSVKTLVNQPQAIGAAQGLRKAKVFPVILDV